LCIRNDRTPFFDLIIISVKNAYIKVFNIIVGPT